MSKPEVQEVLQELVDGYNAWVDKQMKWQSEMQPKYWGFVAHTDLETYLRTQFLPNKELIKEIE